MGGEASTAVGEGVVLGVGVDVGVGVGGGKDNRRSTPNI